MTIFHDILQGLHNVYLFGHFLEIRFLDIWQVYENYSRKTTKDTCLSCERTRSGTRSIPYHISPARPVTGCGHSIIV